MYEHTQTQALRQMVNRWVFRTYAALRMSMHRQIQQLHQFDGAGLLQRQVFRVHCFGLDPRTGFVSFS